MRVGEGRVGKVGTICIYDVKYSFRIRRMGWYMYVPYSRVEQLHYRAMLYVWFCGVVTFSNAT